MSEVISIEKKREEFFKKKSKQEFIKYLKQLKDNELKYEADYILESISSKKHDKDFLNKGVLLLDELAQRTQESSLSNRIKELSKGLKNRITEISLPTLH